MTILLTILSLFAVFVFAISGALAAVRKDMDLFGVLAISFLPALGGGTLRDLVLDLPVFWIRQPVNIWIIIAAALLVFYMSRFVESRKRALVWADAVGLALFAVVGTEVTFAATESYLISIIMGVVTAVAGGLIRDVVCNDVPLVMLKGEVYATAAFAGAGAWCLFDFVGLAGPVATWGAALIGFVVRALGITLGLSLPVAKRSDPPTHPPT